jgi:hypothetical protein
VVVKELKVDFSARRKTNYIVQGGEKYMPGGDGTGPMGYGRLTGRGAGYCAGFGVSGSVNPVEVGYGSGRGRRLRRMFHGVPLPGCAYFGHPHVEPVTDVYVQKELLRRQAKILEEQLEQVKKRLSNLEEEQAKDERNEGKK